VTEEYEDGDVNVVDDLEGDVVDEAALEVPVAVAQYLTKALADNPEDVVVDPSVRGDQVKLSITVNPSDMGRVIGRRGRTAQALRTLVAAAGAKAGVKTNVDIVDV
jgi:predicted RNA-binding protein YlqC (UPF0109 family)